MTLFHQVKVNGDDVYVIDFFVYVGSMAPSSFCSELEVHLMSAHLPRSAIKKEMRTSETDLATDYKNRPGSASF